MSATVYEKGANVWYVSGFMGTLHVFPVRITAVGPSCIKFTVPGRTNGGVIATSDANLWLFATERAALERAMKLSQAELTKLQKRIDGFSQRIEAIKEEQD